MRKLGDVQYVDMDDIRQVDTNLLTFINLNTLDDIVAVKDISDRGVEEDMDNDEAENIVQK